ncbi:MAG: hypothetical protein R2712_19250 [Vicinamibacterales bacterium]
MPRTSLRLQVSLLRGAAFEMATRAALGAGVVTLARQLTLEAMAVALVGGAGGIVARSVLARVPAWLPPSVPPVTAPRLDLTVGAAGALVAVLAGLSLAACIVKWR